MKHDPQDVQCTNLGQSQVLELRRWLGNVALFFAEGKAVPEGSRGEGCRTALMAFPANRPTKQGVCISVLPLDHVRS